MCALTSPAGSSLGDGRSSFEMGSSLAIRAKARAHINKELAMHARKASSACEH